MNDTLETIWEEFSARLRSFILRRVSDEAAADDILQDVFMRIYTQLGSLRDMSRLESWVYQIARNAIIDHYRSRGNDNELPESVAAPEIEAEATAATSLAPSVTAFLDCLPDKYREALLLTEFNGLTQKEASAQLGISLSGAKSRVQRARELLRGLILDCCHVELDRAGRITDYHPHRQAPEQDCASVKAQCET
ncbi:MAG: RNA polymerase sigma factor SigZ [Anaerolinea sp.]|nr:RNA polymerase sigma factor SigZ [Anaerolinea sp.]